MFPTREQISPLLLMDLFTDQLSQIDWQDVRDLLPLDEPNRPWIIARTGPWALHAYSVTDDNSILDDWTNEQDSPDLYRRQREGKLWHLGILVEISANGLVLGRDSIWSVCFDISNHAIERECYCYFLELIKQLTAQAGADVPECLGRKIRDLQHAADVLVGIEQPYMKTLTKA